MPLPTSGNLSLNDIHLEVGGANQDLCGMNDDDFRLLVNKGDGDQQSIAEYRGKSAAFEISEASFFFKFAPIENGNWVTPRQTAGVSSSAINGYANPKHMIPATQVDDNEYLCTNFFDHVHPNTVGNKLFLANMDRSRNISWAKEYTTSGDLAVGNITFPIQALGFDPKMFKLGGNYYAIVYPRFFINLDTEGGIDFVTGGIPYDVGYDFAAGVCKFNSSGQFQWCRYINVKTGLASDNTPNLERSGSPFRNYGQGHIFDKDGYVYLSCTTTVGDTHSGPPTNQVISSGVVKLYLYKINLLTGDVEDTIALSTTSLTQSSLNSQGYSNYGVGAHEDDPSKMYLFMSDETTLFYWEVNKNSMSLGTEKRISFNDTNENEPFIRVSTPVWLPNNKIKIYAQETGFKGLASGSSAYYVIDKSTGAIQYNIQNLGLFGSFDWGLTVNENNDTILISGLAQDFLVNADLQTSFDAASIVGRVPANQQHTLSSIFAERYMSQAYGSTESGFTGFIQGRVYHMGNIESTSQDGDFMEFTTQYGVFVVNKNNLSSNLGTYGTNKYRFVQDTSTLLPNLSNSGKQFTLQNTAFFSPSNSVAPTVFSTNILSTGSNFTPITPANTGGDTY